MPMPLKLSKTGATVLNSYGEVEKTFESREKARAYVQARNLAWRKKQKKQKKQKKEEAKG